MSAGRASLIEARVREWLAEAERDVVDATVAAESYRTNDFAAFRDLTREAQRKNGLVIRLRALLGDE